MGRAELDEFGPGTGDKGVQKCVIALLHWRLLEVNWCFSDFVCDTSAFTLSVPKLRVHWQNLHCASNSLLGTAVMCSQLAEPDTLCCFAMNSIAGEITGLEEEEMKDRL